MTIVEPSASSASRSKRTPLVTKKTGMKTPKPIAASFGWKSGWVIASSRSASFSSAPAMKVPRITSRPSVSAAAAKPTSSSTAPRTRIWAVVFWSRSRSAEIRPERSAVRAATKITAASSTSPTIRTRVAPIPPSPVKKTESRMIAPKSAIDPAASTSWPNRVESCPRP